MLLISTVIRFIGVQRAHAHEGKGEGAKEITGGGDTGQFDKDNRCNGLTVFYIKVQQK